MSRVWDIEPSRLCTKHLAAEHRELHGVFTVIATGKKGYSRHPETLRWVGKLGALKLRHDALKAEMDARGWNHRTPIDSVPAGELYVQDALVNTVEEQFQILRDKGCGCRVEVTP